MKPENCKDCKYFKPLDTCGWCVPLDTLVNFMGLHINCPLFSEPDQDELILADMRYPEPPEAEPDGSWRELKVPVNGILWGEPEAVNHPPHYNQYPVETIQMMYSIWGAEAVYHFCLLNAFKYRMRAGEKGDAAQDLEKERWYLNEAKKYNQ